MAVDLRQVMAAFLTFSMFLMLGNMIKRDHIDPLLEAYPESAIVQYNSLKVSKPAATFRLTEMISDSLWRPKPQPCWQKPSSPIKEERKQPNNGYIFFTLSHAPQYHASQVANAVAVASHLGAQLALPHIRGSKSGHKMQFGEIYDVDAFVRSLKGVVKINKNPPAKLSIHVVSIPDGVSKHFIASKIKPIFNSKPNLKIVTHFNSTKRKLVDSSTPYECLAMFESLKLQPQLQQVVDSMVAKLRGLSKSVHHHYIAVDLRVDGTLCQASKRCHGAQEIGEFLRKIGIERGTSMYLTQTGWSSSLTGFREIFPNTFTKDAIMGVDQKAKFMEYDEIIDFYVCTLSDVFVPSFPGRFYSGVVGRKIGLGKTKILVPANNISATATAKHYVSPFIAKRSHFAYSCFC